MTCCVYIAHAGDHVKIGIAGFAGDRKKTIQTHSPFEVTIKSILCEGRVTASIIERISHYKMRDKWVRGEWFLSSMDEALEIVKSARDLTKSWVDNGESPIQISKRLSLSITPRSKWPASGYCEPEKIL